MVCPGSTELQDEVGGARYAGRQRCWVSALVGMLSFDDGLAQPPPPHHTQTRGSSRYAWDFCRSSRWHGAKRKCD